MRQVRNWVLNNRARFLIVCAAFIVVVFAVGKLSGNGGHVSTTPPASVTSRAPVTTMPSSTSTTLVSRSTSPTATTTTTVPVSRVLPTSAAKVAVLFVQAWANRYDPPKFWHRRVEALCVPSLAHLLAFTNPSNVPAGVRVVGKPSGTGDQGGAEIVVVTTKFKLDLIETVYNGHYRVSSFSEQ